MNLSPKLGVGILMLIGVCIAGGCQFSTAHIAECTLARTIREDKSPDKKTAFFYKQDPILHCCVRMANTPSDTKLKAVWVFHAPDGSDTSIDSTLFTMDGSGWIDFSLTPSRGGLPYGRYSVDLALNGKLDRKVEFLIKPMFETGPIRETALSKEVTESYFPVETGKSFRKTVPVVYAPVYVEDIEPGNELAAEWYTLEANGTKSSIATTPYPITQKGSGWIGFSLRINNSLPGGKYFVAISLNGTVHNTMEFSLD